MRTTKSYDTEYKIQALKMAKEIGVKKTCEELNLSRNTFYGWVKAAKEGKLDVDGYRSIDESLSLTEELNLLRKKVKEQDKEIRRLNELNEFLEEASAFFAASRRK